MQLEDGLSSSGGALLVPRAGYLAIRGLGGGLGDYGGFFGIR